MAVSSSRGRRQRRAAFLPAGAVPFLRRRLRESTGLGLILLGGALLLALLSYSPADPSWNNATGAEDVANLLGPLGATTADVTIQTLGAAAFALGLLPIAWGWRLVRQQPIGRWPLRLSALVLGALLAAAALAPFAAPAPWTGVASAGGAVGTLLAGQGAVLLPWAGPGWLSAAAGILALLLFLAALGRPVAEWAGLGRNASAGLHRLARSAGGLAGAGLGLGAAAFDAARGAAARGAAVRARRADPSPADGDAHVPLGSPPVEREAPARPRRRAAPAAAKRPAAPPLLDLEAGGDYALPPLDLLHAPDEAKRPATLDPATLEANAERLQQVLGDFGVRGEIVRANPGPVVTLYELEPAPGTKSSRVIGLADDIARSMSALSARVAVVPGRNVIGIELPNPKREIVYLRELLRAEAFERTAATLVLALGKDIGGAPVVADLARMPHLLVAGTTGSGKSVAINAMILSLLYRLPPDRLRLVLIDPKMLELSVYDGIPHLLAPVVTEPKKAVVALKWTVREMEDRYRAMSKLGVRNIEGYNQRLREARRRGERLTRQVQTGFDPETGAPLIEDQPLDLTELPYIVVVVDEMADLMLVAGKDIEAAIQRLAQMARAAGIHLIMATQRPSVDVITGTIKANFPTRISFQVTSKIDSRTILGESGAEQLLGQGDMLYMVGGGRINRIHGPFVRDDEVEAVVRFARQQGEPDYVDAVTEEPDDEGGADAFMLGGNTGSGDTLYDQAVALVARERKASTSFIQRHLQIGYNRAARLIEQMEQEGVVGPANHVGKREVLLPDAADRTPSYS